MIGKLVFGSAVVLFVASLFMAAFAMGGDRTIVGAQAFYTAIRYGTAGVFSSASLSEFVAYFTALMAAAANFVFVFWAMLFFSPTKVTSLKWFWWISLIFIVAALYLGVLVTLDERAALRTGYYCWVAALLLMLTAPVVARVERLRALTSARRNNA